MVEEATIMAIEKGKTKRFLLEMFYINKQHNSLNKISESAIIRISNNNINRCFTFI